MHARRLPLAAVAAVATLAALGTGCTNEVERRPPSQRPPVIQLTATSLAFEALLGLGDPAARTVTVTNAGGGSLPQPTATVTYTSGAAWLSATVEGTAPPYTVTVAATKASLAAGTYVASVRLEATGTSISPRTIPVTFVVRPLDMVPSRAALDFAATIGFPAAVPQQVEVSDRGGLFFDLPTVANAPLPTWLSVDRSGAQPPYTVTVRTDATGLGAGVHQATVTLASAGVTADLSVRLTVSDQRTVTVSRRVTYWPQAGAQAPVPDAAVLEVTLRQEHGGELVSRVATPDANRETWTGQVGPAEYWAVVAWADGSQTWVRASQAALDLGDDVPGRPNRASATVPTDVTINLTNLLSWNPFGDALELVSWDAQARVGLVNPPLTIPQDGDVIASTVDWATTFGTLLVPEDTLYQVQFRTATSRNQPPIRYGQAQTFASTTGVPLASGVATALPSRVADVPKLTPGSVSLDWRRSEFEGALPAFARPAPGVHRVSIAAVPPTVTLPAPLGGVGLPLFEAALDGTTPTDQDANAGALPYGRYQPATWVDLFSASLMVGVTRTAPGASTGVLGLRNAVFRYDAVAQAPRPVRPRVGGVQSPTIAGQDALSVRTGVPTTAAIAWDAPATGTPTSYHVVLLRLTASGTASELTPVAHFVLPKEARSLSIPSGVLLPDQTYLAQLVARDNLGDAAASPFRMGVPFGESWVWTERFTTAAAAP